MMRLAIGLVQRRHEVGVMAYDGPSPLDAELTAAGVQVWAGSPATRWAKVDATREWVRTWKPDVVHGVMKRASSVAVLARGGPFRRQPPVLVSDMSTATYARHRLVLWPALVLFGFAEGVVTQTDLNRRSLELLAPWLRGRVRVIRNGVDTGSFAPPDARNRDGPFRFAAVGTVYAVKNPMRVVEAAAVLRERGIDAFRIDWFGRRGLQGDDAPSSAYLTAVAHASHVGVDDHVTFHGQVADVPRRLREAHALLHVSLQEGFPNAVVEGMAAGLPVVVSGVSDLPRIVAEATNGVVVDPRDPASIADGIQRVMETPEAELAAMGARSRELAVRWFGQERFIDEFEALYADLTNGRARGAA